MCLIAAATLGVVACGGDGSNITRTGRTPSVQQADGRLNRAPDPLSVEDIERVRPDSPQAVVLRLWFYAQWGSAPSIVRLYDQRIVRAIGAPAIAGALDQQRSDLLDTRPVVGPVARISAGSLVTVEVLSTADPPRPESFLLRRRGHVWRIVHDSLLEDALSTYVQVETQLRVAPTATSADPRAVRAGRAAARRYRELFLVHQTTPRRSRR